MEALEPRQPANLSNAAPGNLIQPSGNDLSLEARLSPQNDDEHIVHEVVAVAGGAAHGRDPARDPVEPRVVKRVEFGANGFGVAGRARWARFPYILEDMALHLIRRG